MLKQFGRTLLACVAVATLAACGSATSNHFESLKPLPKAVAISGVASFSGKRSFYTVTKMATGYTITDNVTDEQVTIGKDVDALKFADLSVNLRIADKAKSISAADLKMLTELFMVFFNRVPDADSLVYWIDQFKSGQSLDQIVDQFYLAATYDPALTGYSAAMRDVDFVSAIYKNLFGSAGLSPPPDAEVQYWSTDHAEGNATRGQLIRSILIAAHASGHDARWSKLPQLLDNKFAVAHYHAVQQGLAYNTPEEAVSKTTAVAAILWSTDAANALKAIDVFVAAPKPSITDCLATPNLSICKAVLPTLAQCVLNRALAGCTVVLPVPAQCATNPALAGCPVMYAPETRTSHPLRILNIG